MKLKHPLDDSVYSILSDGRVEVEDSQGNRGVFERGAVWVSGILREADPQMIGWLLGDVPRRDAGTEVAAVSARRPGESPGAAGVHRPPEGEGSRGMDLGLAGRNVLVTAASRGIGLAIAQQFADEGCGVAFCARGQAGIEAATQNLEARGARVFARAVDVADADAFKRFVSDAVDALGGLDVFVSNASGGAGPGEKAWQAGFDVDVMGAVRGVEAAMPALVASDAAAVVFISSTAALEYLGIPQAYTAMKAALTAHAADLSQSLAPRGIRVNTVSPGPIYFEGGNWEMIEQAMPAMYEGALAQCAIGRMGRPEEVARAVVFLASSAASLITGANLVCDGGFTRRVHY